MGGCSQGSKTLRAATPPSFKGTVVNLALSSLLKGHLNITLTVPFKSNIPDPQRHHLKRYLSNNGSAS